MYRVRVPLIAGGIVAVVLAGCLVFLSSTLGDSITERLGSQVEHADQALRRSDQLEAVNLTSITLGIAREEEFAQAFAKTAEQDRRQTMFVAVEARRARLEKKAIEDRDRMAQEAGVDAGQVDVQKPALIAVVDKNGKVVTREQNINAAFGDDYKSKYPSVGIALQGTANKDIWNFEGQMYRVASAPIRSAAGEVVGALVIGYVQSVADALAEERRIGTEVAYFLDGKIHASSFRGSSSESAEEKSLASQLFDGPKLADPALAGNATRPFTAKINGEEWVGVAAPLTGNATRSKSGVVVLTSLSAAKAPLARGMAAVLLLGLVGVLAAVGASSMTARRFLNSLDTVEGGVNEVINGNRDHVFESPSPDYEGLANGLNVMLARLLGRPDPGDEDDVGVGDEGRGSAQWSGDLFVDEAAAAAAGGAAAAEIAALASEPADAYYQRIWQEYATARQQTGEGTQGLTAESFVAKLKQNEATLARKYNARMVRFKVHVKGNQTTLKPVPIN